MQVTRPTGQLYHDAADILVQRGWRPGIALTTQKGQVSAYGAVALAAGLDVAKSYLWTDRERQVFDTLLEPLDRLFRPDLPFFYDWEDRGRRRIRHVAAALRRVGKDCETI